MKARTTEDRVASAALILGGLVAMALLPVWAEQHGRGETAAIGQSFRQ